MHRLILTTAALIALCTPLLITAAQAETNYPWCAYLGMHDGGGVNCGFTTLRQCEATISGVGGYCDRNPRYRGSRHSQRQERR
jgi:hypothetical protein